MHPDKANNTAKWKVPLFMLMVVTFVCCFSQEGFPQKSERPGNTILHNGNTITFAREKKPNLTIVKDSATGEEEARFEQHANPPRKLNGKKIYAYMYDEHVSKPKIKAPDRSLADYLIRNTTPEFANLDDGEYFFVISNVVINAEGKVVYYENDGIFKIGGYIEKQAKQKARIDSIMTNLFSDALSFTPATVAGNPVDYLITNTIGYRNGESIVVKNHKVTWLSIEEQ